MFKRPELSFDDEPVYKSCPTIILESSSNDTNMQPPPLTRSLNIELEGLGQLDFHLDLVKDDSVNNIVDC